VTCRAAWRSARQLHAAGLVQSEAIAILGNPWQSLAILGARSGSFACRLI
jgi:hypothetical protein